MKKILYLFIFIFILMIFPKSVFAIDKIPVELEYSFSYPKQTNYNLQGFTSTDKYLIAANRYTDDLNTKLYVFDKNSFSLNSDFLYNPYEQTSYQHANDMTYNPKTDEIIIVGNSQTAYVLDANTLETKREVTMPSNVYAIAYNENTDTYIISNFAELDSNFNSTGKTFKIPTNLTQQAIVISNNKLYFLCYEAGRKTQYQSSTDAENAGTNIIYEYDLSLNKVVNSYFIKAGYGEGEDLTYITNESIIKRDNCTYKHKEYNMVIGFNAKGLNEMSFYKIPYLSYEYDEKIECNEKSVSETTVKTPNLKADKDVILLLTGLLLLISGISLVTINLVKKNKYSFNNKDEK